MNIYVASPYSEKLYAAEARDEIEAVGHTVTSSWIQKALDDDRAYEDFSHEELRNEALADIEDILKSNMMVLLSRESKTGGMHVETGMALITLKPIVIVGDRQNVFHFLRCPRVDSIQEAIAEIAQWKPAERKWSEAVPSAVRKEARDG